VFIIPSGSTYGLTCGVTVNYRTKLLGQTSLRFTDYSLFGILSSQEKIDISIKT
jgi:hypothetical protein